MANHLNGLAMESKLAFGGFLQIVARGPGFAVCVGVVVEVTAERPDAGGFTLRLGETLSHGGREGAKADDSGVFHRR